MNLSTVSNQLPTNGTFRFRRWSRKGYAVFFSLGRAVTIGQLSASVSDRFLAKNTSQHSVADLFENGCQGKDDSISIQNEWVAEEITGLPQAIVNCLLSTEMLLANAALTVCNKQNNIHYSNITEGSRHNAGYLPFFYAYNPTNI